MSNSFNKEIKKNLINKIAANRIHYIKTKVYLPVTTPITGKTVE